MRVMLVSFLPVSGEGDLACLLDPPLPPPLWSFEDKAKQEANFCQRIACHLPSDPIS